MIIDQELPVKKKKKQKERKDVAFYKISKGELLLKGNVSEFENILHIIWVRDI